MRLFIKNLIKQHRETIAYLIVGSITVFLNIVSYVVFVYILGGRDPDMTQIMIANTIAFFIAVIFAYFANTLIVFRQNISWSTAWQFFTMRIGTLLADNGGMWLLLLFLDSDIIAKVVISIVLIVANYLISKFIIFRRKV
jgi:putative flippase GtrA